MCLVRASLKRLKYHNLSFISCFLSSYANISRQIQTLLGEENLLRLLVGVCYILKHSYAYVYQNFKAKSDFVRGGISA